MTTWTPKATIQFANDLITASLVQDITSGTRAAIQGIADALISAAIAADPTLAGNILGAVEEAVPSVVAGEMDTVGIVVGLPKSASPDSSRPTLPVSWQERTISDPWSDTFEDVESAVWTDIGRRGGQVPLLDGTGRTMPSQLPANLVYTDGAGRVPVTMLPSGVILADGSVPATEYRLGSSVRLREVFGARGARLQFTSAVQGEDYRPYLEVDAGDWDVYGDVIAGYQAHVTGTGASLNTEERVYWFLEAHGLQHAAGANPDFEGWYSMGVSNRAELTERGKGRAFILDAGNRPGLAMHFYKPYVELQPNTAFTLDDRARAAIFDGKAPHHNARSIGTLVGEDYLNWRREGAIGHRLLAIADTANGYARTFYGRARGLVTAATQPLSGDVLGATEFGSVSEVLEPHVHPTQAGGNVKRVGAAIKAIATENWAATTARGSKVAVQTTPTGSTALVDSLTVQEPATAGQTSILLSVNRDGTVTQTRVEVGAPDSGGTGYRALRIAN